MSDNEVSETALPWPTAKPMRGTVRHITRGRLRTTVITNLNIFFNLPFFFFWPHMAWGMLVPRPGIKSGPSAVKAPSPNHWTTKEFPVTPSSWSISYAGEEDQKGGIVKATEREARDFPSGPVVKGLPCNAGDAGSVSSWGCKIPHASEQLSPCVPQLESWCTLVKESVRCNKDSVQPNT